MIHTEMKYFLVNGKTEHSSDTVFAIFRIKLNAVFKQSSRIPLGLITSLFLVAEQIKTKG